MPVVHSMPAGASSGVPEEQMLDHLSIRRGSRELLFFSLQPLPRRSRAGPETEISTARRSEGLTITRQASQYLLFSWRFVLCIFLGQPRAVLSGALNSAPRRAEASAKEPPHARHHFPSECWQTHLTTATTSRSKARRIHCSLRKTEVKAL